LVYRLQLPSNYPMHPVVNLKEWEIDRILGHRTTSTRLGKTQQYLVRWKGLDAAEDSWLNESELRNAPELKRDY
ncbi:hypothetical protein PLEOSDRAFT_1017081, partial [Pleurotus ostreatus PC15]